MKEPIKNKKGQVDIALTIGSIIVPLGAIFGALIFAWVMLAPVNDAAKLAATISYDIATISDVAYSVPDEIIVRYTPPGQCEFSENGKYLTCLNGFMNVTGFSYNAELKETRTPKGDLETLYSLDSRIDIVLPSSIMYDDKGERIEQPHVVSYPAFGNMRDFGILSKGTDIPIETEGYIKIEKNRQGLYDTLYTEHNLEEPLEKTIRASFSACPDKKEDIGIHLPPGHYITKKSEDTICLNKERHYSDLSGNTLNSEIYCFNFSKQKTECSFNLQGFAQDTSEINTYEPASGEKGTCASIKITSSCYNTPGECVNPEITYEITTENEDGEPLC